MNLRSVAFWALDSLSGAPLRKELQDVQFLNSREGNVAERRLELLDEHLTFASSKVPYYRHLNGASSLAEFPVLKKEDIRAHSTEMLAEGIDCAKVHTASTSGSTGTPFRLFQSQEKRRRVNAETIYFGNIAGYKVGNLLWYLKLWTSRSSHSRLGAFTKNIRAIDISSFSEKDVEPLFDLIRKSGGKSSIVGYSSSLETIAKYIENRGREKLNVPKISSVVGQSEPLSQEAREILGRAFGVYPVGRYGMEETGILAQQTPSPGETYRMNLASHAVEVLKLDSDERVAEGETGRVVVTDLFNRAQPLIRYDTGDLATVGAIESETGFVASLSRLDGRSRDRIYDVNDRPLTPLIAYNFWWKFPDILQYQIVQRGRAHYLLRVSVTDNFDQEATLIEEFRRQVGSSAFIEVEYGGNDYRHSSGKRKSIVSEYTPPDA